MATLMWNSPGLLIETSSRTSPVWWRFSNGVWCSPEAVHMRCRSASRAKSTATMGAHPGARLTSAVTRFTSVTRRQRRYGRVIASRVATCTRRRLHPRTEATVTDDERAELD